ncbi:hypothetical protein WAB17_03975 [Parerythrobacter aurantius]|uniref:hypothetical protein n=1 Tax=Parerythrobacter aurantius TaxID=3127706 RepID=UPI00324AF098
MKTGTILPLAILAAALAACGQSAEPAPPSDGMELAEDASDGTVADEMDSGAPPIREGGGMAPGAADNPNEPVVPDTAPQPAESEAAEVR